jgi:hypothetical protein
MNLKSLTFLLASSLLVIAVMSYRLLVIPQQLRSENSRLEQALFEALREGQWDDSLFLADEKLFIEADLEGAMYLLMALNNSASVDMQQRIEQRKSYLQALMNGRNNQSAELSRQDQIIMALRMRKSALEVALDSLEAGYVTDKRQFEKRQEELQQRLKQLEEELRLKERVKVISFAGSKGATVHYLGEVSNGKANGGGIGIWTTGSVYRGEWRNNVRNGKGSFTWADGERYEGNYIDGRREGEGIYYWPSGERYEGQWSNDQRNGQGTLFDLDGNVRYKGIWKDDKPVVK